MEPVAVRFTIIMFLIFLILITSINGKRILIFTPFPSYNDQIVYRAVSLALQQRGHEVVVFTPNPLNEPALENYKEIDFGVAYDILGDPNVESTISSLTTMESDDENWQMLYTLTEKALSHPELRQLYSGEGDKKFDAVIVELGIDPAIYGLARKLDAPLIGIKSHDVQYDVRCMNGESILSLNLTDWEFTEAGLDLSLWQRIKNFIFTWLSVHEYDKSNIQSRNKIAKKYFGDDLPDISELERNISLILLERPLSISTIKPELSNIIYFDGIHIARKPPSLKIDVRDFVDDAKEGFIYINLGTEIQSRLLSSAIEHIFMEVFSKLPYRILWKHNRNEFQRKPENVLITSWVPQQTILSHRNIKLFIYQGDLQSSEEAIHYAVPILGIPFTFNHYKNIAKMVSMKVGKYINHENVTKEELYNSIMEITIDERYTFNMKEKSIIFKDKPFNSLWNIIWWIEYVIRHEGAHHLRHNSDIKPRYHKSDTDVIILLIIFIFASFLIFLLFLYNFILFIIRLCRRILFAKYKKRKSD